MVQKNTDINKGYKNRKNDSAVVDVLRLVLSIMLLVLAAAVVIFTYTYIKKNTNSKDAVTPVETKYADVDKIQEIHLDKAPEPGLFKDSDGNTHYLLSNSEIQYYDSDQIMQTGSMKILRNAWIIRDENVYFLDNNGIAATGEYTEKAMRYEFDINCVLQSMHYNTNFVPQSTDTDIEYPGLVRGKMIWTFLDRYKSMNGFYAIMYKGTTDSLSEYLGGPSNKQYSLPFSITVDGKNIYYLAYCEDPTEAQERINGKIYRMRAGDTTRDFFADGAEAYKLIKDMGKTAIVYSSNGRLYYSEGAIKSDVLVSFDENLSYIVQIEDDKAYLSTTDGVIVTIPGGEFNTGGFSYELSEDGEILSVKEAEAAVRGNYLYSSEVGEIFNSSMSRIIRKNDTGVKEILSGSFPGTLYDYHYDSVHDEIFAVYKDLSGKSRIAKITPDGDVEYLTDIIPGTDVRLYSIESDSVCVAYKYGSAVKYVKLSRNYTVHLTSAIEPIIEYSDSTEPLERSIENYDEAVSEGPGYSYIDSGMPEMGNTNPPQSYNGPIQPVIDGNVYDSGTANAPGGTSQAPGGVTDNDGTGMAAQTPGSINGNTGNNAGPGGF